MLGTTVAAIFNTFHFLCSCSMEITVGQKNSNSETLCTHFAVYISRKKFRNDGAIHYNIEIFILAVLMFPVHWQLSLTIHTPHVQIMYSTNNNDSTSPCSSKNNRLSNMLFRHHRKLAKYHKWVSYCSNCRLYRLNGKLAKYQTWKSYALAQQRNGEVPGT